MNELDPSLWSRVLDDLRAIPINTLFVQSILCRHVDGHVFADDVRDPHAFYGVHPYGMALLWGRPTRPRWLAWLREHLRQPASTEWLQVYPNSWVEIVDAVGGIEKYTRVNFQFERAAYEQQREDRDVTIVPTTEAMFDRIEGSVVAKRFWRDAAQFVSSGGGFTALVDGVPAATAFCSYRHGTQLEIGIETSIEHRGNGLARAAVQALIDDCLRRGLEPVWACRLENTPSYRLAGRLGFRVTAELPYYRIVGRDSC